MVEVRDLRDKVHRKVNLKGRVKPLRDRDRKAQVDPEGQADRVQAAAVWPT